MSRTCPIIFLLLTLALTIITLRIATRLNQSSTNEYTLQQSQRSSTTATERFTMSEVSSAAVIASISVIKLHPTIPIFVKLHVVGSTTFTNMIRNISASGAVSFNYSKNRYWNVEKCGQEQGHESAVAFAAGGVGSLLCCVDPNFLPFPEARIKLVALLRCPVEKYLSSLFTFATGRYGRVLKDTRPANHTIETLGP